MRSLRGIVLALGQRADASLVSGGFSPLRSTVRKNLGRVAEDLAQIGPGAFPEAVARALAQASTHRGLHAGKILPRIAGASLVTARFGRGMTPTNRTRAYVAKALFECEQDVLDDILDSGAYAYPEARRLYALCLTSLVDSELDTAEYAAHLEPMLAADHKLLVPLLSHVATELNGLLRSAPSRRAILPELIQAAERLGIAQSATVLIREPTVDLAAARSLAMQLWSPDPDAPWFERLAAHASWVLCHTLIDLCFAEEPMTAEELAAHRAIWYDLNVHLSLFDHVAGLEKDLRDGIYNFAWAAIREARGGLEVGPVTITREEKAWVVAHAAAFARRAIARDAERFGGADGFYPFLAVLVAVVLTARGLGNETWALEAFLQAFGSGYHSATYSQQGSPRRTQRGFVTVPRNPRDFRMPS